jgi:hypothetical protein
VFVCVGFGKGCEFGEICMGKGWKFGGGIGEVKG